MDAIDELDEIIGNALLEAAGVKCSAIAYRAALREWVHEIQSAIQTSEETAG